MAKSTDPRWIPPQPPLWFRKEILPFYDVIPSVDWTTPGLAENAMLDGRQVHTVSLSGTIDEDTFPQVLEKLLTACQMRVVTNDYVWDKDAPPECGRVWAVSDSGSMVVSVTDSHELAVTIQSTDYKHIEAVSDIGKAVLKDEAVEEYVHAMVQKNGKLTFQRVGKPKQALERSNYSAAVLKGYDRVVKEFNAEKPRGRIAIFDGPPGTGKSYALRALLSDIDGIHVILPSHLVSSLADPSILPLLIDLKNSLQKPIIFYVEDADLVVSRRGSDNMSSISSLLNLGDGILGDCLDIRVIVTTNLSRADFDPAIQRPGRMVATVKIEALTPKEATAVYQRITGTEETIEKTMTLAEVYSKALDDGFEPIETKSKMGF